MRMLRHFLQSVLILFGAVLAFAVIKGPDENAGVGLALLGLLTFFVFLLGLLWPESKQEKHQPIRPSTEIFKSVGPLSAYPTMLVILAVPFFYFAWEAHFHPHNEYRRIFASAHELFGNMGVVLLNVALGSACLVGAVFVYRYLKPIYRRLS